MRFLFKKAHQGASEMQVGKLRLLLSHINAHLVEYCLYVTWQQLCRVSDGVFLPLCSSLGVSGIEPGIGTMFMQSKRSGTEVWTHPCKVLIRASELYNKGHSSVLEQEQGVSC